MRRGALLLLGLFLAGCATTPPGEETAARRAGIYTSLAAAYLQGGDARQSLREAQQAIQADSGYAAAYNVMGLAYQQLERPELARDAFRRAVALDPKNPDYRNNYGAFLLGRGEYDRAAEQFRKALEDPLYGTPQYAWTNLASAYRGMNEPAKAREALHHALGLVPGYLPAVLQLAELDFAAGEIDKADGQVRMVLAQEPRNVDALLLAGRIALRLGRTGEAEDYLRRAVDAAPYSAAGKEAQSMLLRLSGGG